MAGELTPEEKAARRRGLGGSDAGPVHGVGYGTPLEVWLDKVHGVEQPVTGPMRRGHALEPMVAAMAGDRLGLALDPVAGQVWSRDVPWLFATLDYRSPSGEVVECKAPLTATRGGPDGRWGPDGDPDGLPLHYLFQACHQLAADPSVPVVHVAALFADSWELRVYPVERDARLIDGLVESEGRWWERHVVGGEAPAILDVGRDYRALGQVPTIRREVELTSTGLDDPGGLVTRLRLASETANEAGRLAKELRAELRRVMGQHDVGLLEGRRVVEIRTSSRGVRSLHTVKDKD